MKWKKTEDSYIIKLEKGDEIIKSITEFCKKQEIKAGFLSGIGALDEVTIGIFDIKTKKYSFKTIKEDLEILSLNGNISSLNESPFIHLHIILSDEQMKAFGGHLKKGIISITGEILLIKSKKSIKRNKDIFSGLNLWSL